MFNDSENSDYLSDMLFCVFLLVF